jgi:3-hydroxyacyl-[acyl-carrier-protein] dehydratase
MSDTAGETALDTADILRVMRMIPHRYPMLLVDKVIKMKADESAVGIKNVTYNEPYFQGHFPSRPVMPGVMVIESMAQTAGVLVVYTLGPAAEGKLVYFMSVDSARFRRPIMPGDQMHIHVRRERRRGNVWRFAAEVLIDGQLAADATVTAMILDQ